MTRTHRTGLRQTRPSRGRPHPEIVVLTGASAGVGRATARAQDTSLQLWVRTHRGWLALAGLGMAGIVYAALKQKRR